MKVLEMDYSPKGGTDGGDYCRIRFYDYNDSGEKKPKKGYRSLVDFVVYYDNTEIVYYLTENMVDKFCVIQNWEGELTFAC